MGCLSRQCRVTREKGFLHSAVENERNCFDNVKTKHQSELQRETRASCSLWSHTLTRASQGCLIILPLPLRVSARLHLHHHIFFGSGSPSVRGHTWWIFIKPNASALQGVLAAAVHLYHSNAGRTCGERVPRALIHANPKSARTAAARLVLHTKR